MPSYPGETFDYPKGYIIQSARQFYLSLAACMTLVLLPDTFPHCTLPIVGAEASYQPFTATGPTPPSTIPFAPLEENVTALESWLRQHFSATAFNISRTPLPVMAGKPHHIYLMPGATPYACHTPASVPRH